MTDIMTPRQRLISAIKGEQVDRLPWSPNLAYWWDFQSDDIKGMEQVELLEKMGADPLIRGVNPLFDMDLGECSIKEEIKDGRLYKFISTPIGNLQAMYVRSNNGSTWFLTEHPVKCVEDYKIVRCLFDNMTLTANYENFLKDEAKYGERALLVPMLVPELNYKTAFQAMVEFWVGTEQLAYDVLDYPDEIEITVQAMRRVSKIAAEIAANSPALAFITWEDTSTQNISPTFFGEYIVPEINEWCDILHSKGKLYMQHACGHLCNLMPQMAQSKINGIESISPNPTGNITMKDARAKLPRDKFLIGGIEPTVFLNSTMEELEVYTKQLISDMEGYPFVLANSDSCPPGVDFEKFVMVSKIVKGEI